MRAKEQFRGGWGLACAFRFAAFEMGGPNQIACIRAGGKEKAERNGQWRWSDEGKGSGILRGI